MSRRIVLRRDAETDIDGISDYIAHDNLDAARRLREMVRTVRVLHGARDIERILSGGFS